VPQLRVMDFFGTSTAVELHFGV